MKFGIGQPLKRKEDDKFLTGNGSYTDDISFRNLAHMYIIRSPFAFAEIKSIDFSEAYNLSGVISIIDHQTIKKLNINPMLPGFTVKNKDGSDMLVTSRNILATKKVRYVGQPILAIIAIGKPPCTDRLSGIKNKVATNTPLNIRVPPYMKS